MLRTKLSILLFILSISGIFAQKYGTLPIEMDKRFIYARVSWISENSFCIVADKGFNEGGFIHFIFHYDSTGALLRNPLKFQTAYSSQEEYCFSLGRTVFYLEDEKSDMGGNLFRIDSYVRQDGILHDERNEIFFIRHAKEYKKLENDNPVFESYVGTSRQKALLTYNNDFVDPFSESLQFRILDENVYLTPTDTLKLPYNDRLCNIIDVIFDDEKMEIYLLCNLLEDAGDKKRKFLKTVFVKYNVLSKTMVEINEELPVFSKSKVQHIIKENKIYYSGLKTDETDPANWSVAFAEIDLLNMKVVLAKNTTPAQEFTKEIYIKKKLNSSSIFPIGFSVDIDGNYSAGWIKSYSLQQIPAMNNPSGPNGGMPMILVPAIGIAGMAILAGVALAINAANSQSIKSNHGIWFSYSPVQDKFMIDTMENPVLWNNYYTYNIAHIEVNQSNYCMYNSQSDAGKEFSTIKMARVGADKDTIHKSINEIYPDFPVNIIFPGSGYKTSDRSYFIGQYFKSNDPNAREDTLKEDQLYLIIFE